MTEASLPPSRQRIINPAIAKPIDNATQGCQGCLYNCYMMEETLGLDFTSVGAFFRSLIFTLAEIPTLIQLAKVTANRKKSGWGKGSRTVTESKQLP
jgi:hypothetical protein